MPVGSGGRTNMSKIKPCKSNLDNPCSDVLVRLQLRHNVVVGMKEPMAAQSVSDFSERAVPFQAGTPLFFNFYSVSDVNMSKNTHITSETIALTVAINVIGHQTKEIIYLFVVSRTPVWAVGCVQGF